MLTRLYIPIFDTSTDSRLLADCWQMVNQQLADGRLTVGQLSADSWLTDGQQSADFWLTDGRQHRLETVLHFNQN